MNLAKTQIFLLFFFLLLASSLIAHGQDNQVVVRGRRPDQQRVEYPGSGLRFFPNGSSQDDLAAHLKRQGAFATVASERPLPFGFSLPRVRGQDARFTQIFIDDLPLADPFAALPLVEEMDLPAFAAVEATSGSAPFEVPAIASRGALHFQVFADEPMSDAGAGANASNIGSFRGNGGIRVADAAATTSWLRAVKSGVAATSQLYLRQLNSRGNFRYYDDAGTPLNHGDDEVVRRGNNDRVSRFAMPAFFWRGDATTVRAFGLWNQSRQGLPSLARNSNKFPARQEHNIGLARIAVEQKLAPDGDVIYGAMGLISDRRRLDDPSGAILVVRDQDERRITTQTADLGWRGGCIGDFAACRIVLRVDQTAVKSSGISDFDSLGGANASTTVLRSVRHAIAALRTRDQEFNVGSIEAKVDVATYGGSSAMSPRPAWSLGWRLPVLFSVRPYGQLAGEERPPSLLESDGDGALVMAAPGLRTEGVSHIEFGLDHEDDSGERAVHVAIFHDERKDAIVIVPSSISSYRAVNLSHTSSITGVEFSAEKSLDLLSSGALRASASWVWFRTQNTGELRIPGVPFDQGAVSVAQPIFRKPWRSVVARWTSRRRGSVYRDVANDIKLPPWWIHDAAIDIKWRCGQDTITICSRVLDFDLGIAVTNVADAMATTYQTSSGQSGKTGYSDVWGVPLPGQAWTVSLGASF